MVANVVQVSIAISGSLCATTASAMLALHTSANRIAVLRVGQRSPHNRAPPVAPAAAASAQPTATALFGPVGVKIVPSATTANPAAMTVTVSRVRVSMPRAARCALSRS